MTFFKNYEIRSKAIEAFKTIYYYIYNNLIYSIFGCCCNQFHNYEIMLFGDAVNLFSCVVNILQIPSIHTLYILFIN